ncbi:vegetative cell wall protein gp1 [Glarea lozoyensis ATCC 20868]|uniref:Vegetative cell wall protein gp1 n=1 Tax=Glarea lozoyensis (strain ATCC 20868 / MF5171) TaxID=1116229 RepID=S3D395_GLAL2|nr:vegetative cell wall protein gp1 [Glarea lozoyensis ATCC 20868]EPE31634.1 vegetative cell wall protein gp1 [Glarea lozoyensis ATCC 20868]
MNYNTYNTPPGHPGAGYYGFSATPSPAASPSGGAHGFYAPRNGPSPRHSHTRHTSSGDTYGYTQSPRAFSPRYNSKGDYATAANVSRNKSSWSGQRQESRQRRSSFSHRTPYNHGDSDEDEYEYVEYVIDGVIYRAARRPTKTTHNYRGHGTDHYYSQGQTYDRDEYDESPQYQPSPRRRRQSSSTPQRPTSARTSATPKKPPPAPKATEADARKHRIPPGYSLKNWDPSEEPIMLLGSVFDANSLGKWVYDWTVYHHGPATPIADMAGELWLLLIQLAGKVKRAEECMPRIRKEENREMVEDFIESGERLTDKLKKLLKACETPMLKAGKKHGKESAQLGKNAGTEFVDSIFGRDRQLEQTEKFMSSIRLWNLRFDANCEDILRRPQQ